MVHRVRRSVKRNVRRRRPRNVLERVLLLLAALLVLERVLLLLAALLVLALLLLLLAPRCPAP